MDTLYVYDEDNKLQEIYSGYPWHWSVSDKTLTVQITESDGFMYHCEHVTSTVDSKKYYAYFHALKKEEV